MRADYRHHRTGEDNGDAHLKSLLVHHEVIRPGDEGAARPRAVAARLLRRVRRSARQAAYRQGDGRVRRHAADLSRRARCLRSRRARSPRRAPRPPRPGARGRHERRADESERTSRSSPMLEDEATRAGSRRPIRGWPCACEHAGPRDRRVLEKIGHRGRPRRGRDGARSAAARSTSSRSGRARARSITRRSAVAAFAEPLPDDGARGERAGAAEARARAAGARHRGGAGARGRGERSSATPRGIWYARWWRRGRRPRRRRSGRTATRG